MLDPNDGHSGVLEILNRLDKSFALRLRQPSGNLIEQEDARPGRQRTGQFETFSGKQGKTACCGIRMLHHAGDFKGRQSLALSCVATKTAAMRGPGKRVFKDRQI
ncbi:hypothetical protein GALL_532810 [mine drainage metagenome]|uniref:Uncharacterized protein n=1 Tax=mine drainage metagenome TaxID=410659 RepID=A0A1J5P271_9ZZZZ